MTETRTIFGFPVTFWVANVMELFERAAYYGLNSVLAVYLTNSVATGGLGFSESSVGFLQSIVYAATYVIPILGGALADRYGYRRMLLFCFSLLAIGYFAAGSFSTYGMVFVGLLVMATGGGLFKPIISGTIARTTTEKNSAFGFGVYYWMINLGAFLAPLFVSYLKGFSWRAVFIASASYCALMLFPAVFLYRDPHKTEGGKGIAEVLHNAAMVLGDARFMLMIVVYSGFWILYFQNFGTVLWYLRDFIDPAPVNNLVNGALGRIGIPPVFSFDAEHVTIINAGTIILLQVVVSWIVKEWKALPTMVSGMALGGVGFLCLAASMSPWVFILGIAVFSIGEMTAHPKYYSFVGLVAPQDKKAVYMGYAFLYGVFGSLIGSNAGGFLYEMILKPVAGTPEGPARARMFWLMFVVLDLVALSLLWLFARAFGEDTPSARSGARLVMFGVYGLLGILGGVAMYLGAIEAEPQWKMVIQGGIFVLLGNGGLVMNARHREAHG